MKIQKRFFLVVILILLFIPISYAFSINEFLSSIFSTTGEGFSSLIKCKDSDGGKDWTVKGTTTLGKNKKTDSCVGNKLVEYFCSGELKIKNTVYTCPSGKCLDGACIDASLGECSINLHCQSLNTDCKIGKCDTATGVCKTENKPETTSCVTSDNSEGYCKYGQCTLLLCGSDSQCFTPVDGGDMVCYAGRCENKACKYIPKYTSSSLDKTCATNKECKYNTINNNWKCDDISITANEVCNDPNKYDEDGDGLANCEDPECCDNSVCAGKSNCCNSQSGCQSNEICKVQCINEKWCSDLVDNDNDGCKNGVDSDCNGAETACSDGIDNDCDGLIDCADNDCFNNANCVQNCGSASAATALGGACDSDADCSTIKGANDEKSICSQCTCQIFQCSDGIDNDADILIDLADPGCVFKTDNIEQDIVGSVELVCSYSRLTCQSWSTCSNNQQYCTETNCNSIKKPCTSSSSNAPSVSSGDLVGCSYGNNNKIIALGTRAKVQGTPKSKYCDLDGTLLDQKIADDPCENDYECKSNACKNGKCFDVTSFVTLIKQLKCATLHPTDTTARTACEAA